ncbi:NAD(P)H-quinone oxidoreductase subunit 3 [Helicobacter marmotae]|uniref:NADH-quinone oxidoreductase subunit n=1 Tax=Helicobacter marmotae TaxID=152490 RepID=A0A3D8I6R3_9HELI|nr:NAD(P)H-quinone oxidoreductase subunit 3 [Helicobacter marmotae]RDU60434.1 NADH-quinone oxidoreductase subunit A [Helicobacter marmotae]
MSHSVFEYPYFGVFVLFVLTCVAFTLTLRLQRILSRKLAKKEREKLKLSTYECGPTPARQQNKISTHFFILALLFILFDIEIIFMLPWAIDFKYFAHIGLGSFIFVEMLSFIAFLVIGFIYAWKKGALSWQNIK